MKNTNKRKYDVTFCIPEYNCLDGTVKLVEQLLSNPSENFQVVIVDDCSNDGTYEQLEKIKDSRYKLLRNENNIGAKRNWYKSLISGDGDWLYLVMGRDKLGYQKIDNLIDILHVCEKNKEFYLKDTKESIIDTESKIDQIDKLVIFGDHPTGAIYNREALLELGDKEYYFETDFDYPEILIAKDIICKYNAKYINSGVFIYEVNVDKVKVKSNYTKNDKILFYFPEKRIQQCIVTIDAQRDALEKNNLLNKLNKIIRNQFIRLLRSATIEWIFFNYDNEWTGHYNTKIRIVGINEILRNELLAFKKVFKEYDSFLYFITKMEMSIFGVYYLLKSIFRIIKLKLKR